MLAKPPNLLLKRLRRTGWSLLKRVRPMATPTIPYDRGLRIRVRLCDRLGKRIYLQGYTEREHATLLDAYLRPGMTYFDVGANFGQFTLVAAARVGPAGQVHSFEASSVMHAQAAANVAINGFSHVTVNHAAVSHEPGILELKVCAPGQEGFNSLGTPMRQDGLHIERVPAMTLDVYAAEHGVTRIDLLKIDVEGAELQVIRGASRLLSSGAVTVVCCEFNPVTLRGMGATASQLAAELRGFGYQLYTFDEHHVSITPVAAMDNEGDSANLLAIRDADAFIAGLRRA